MSEKTNSNIYLFCGEDSFSAFEKAKLWKQKFIEKYDDINTFSFYGAGLTAAEIQSALESMPFLSEKKLVLINNFLAEGDTEEQKLVVDLLDNLADFVVLVFYEQAKPDARMSLYKKLVKLANVEDFPAKTGVMLNRWIVERAGKRGLRLGDKEAALMADLVGPNLWNLSNEIDKLALYVRYEGAAGDGSVEQAGVGYVASTAGVFGGAAGGNMVSVSVQLIEQVVSTNASSSIFKLTDQLGEKKLKEAMRTMEVLVESGEEIVGMLFMLVRHFRIMAQVKDLAERGEQAGVIAKTIKEHPFVVSKVYTQAKGFSRQKIAQIYKMLMEVDAGFKTGRIKVSTADQSELVREMEVLVAKVCL